ncbi:hypothetical protein BB559_002918 [Furculomyces boomerangus]|uniref:uracil phosphoribosyltransferase n=1 Tax=Furculomyces boomerangus TaxID=61424 RepID=A0A2T9YR56_9FUNG|nr:hypothetical protein BB559_002918 [Furculomyces boomerangus]
MHDSYPMVVPYSLCPLKRRENVWSLDDSEWAREMKNSVIRGRRSKVLLQGPQREDCLNQIVKVTTNLVEGSENFQANEQTHPTNLNHNSNGEKNGSRKSLSVLFSIVNENDEDVNDELSLIQKELREIKLKISSQSKVNFSLERDVRYLDSRIALLIQNRMAAEDMKDLASHLEDVNQNTKSKPLNEIQLQKYGNLFFLLQSEPIHIATLSRLVNLAEIDTLLQTVMFTLFGNQYESREENLLLTMFQLVLSAQFEMSTEFSSLLRANTPVSRMMMTYTRRGPGQSYLKNVIAPEINRVVQNSSLDLEINPLKVHEEINKSKGNPIVNILTEQASADIQVIETVKPRVVELIKISNRFIDSIISNIDMVPYGIRWICKQIKSLTRRRYPKSTDKDVCSLIGGFFFLRFLNPAIVTPQAYMLIDADPTKNPRRTLTLVAKMLQNLANKPSYSKEAYMESLQPFVEANQKRINAFLFDLCDIGDFYDSLEMDQYMTLTRKERSLSITLNEMYNTHILLCQYLDQLSSSPSSKLRILVDALGPCPSPVPRSENFNINLKLYSRWDTPIHSTLEAMASQNEFTVHDIMYMEAKSILVQILRSMPMLGAVGNDGTNLAVRNLRKTDHDTIDLLYIAQQAATSRDSVLVRKGIKVRELLHQLESEKLISLSNGYKNLSEEVVVELEHLGNLHEQLDNELKNLTGVYKTIQDHNEYLHSQLETYRAYLENARIQAGLVSSGYNKKKKNVPMVPAGVSIVQSTSSSSNNKQKNSISGFSFANKSSSPTKKDKTARLERINVDVLGTDTDSGSQHTSPVRQPININTGKGKYKFDKINMNQSPVSSSPKSPFFGSRMGEKVKPVSSPIDYNSGVKPALQTGGILRFSHNDLEKSGVIVTSNVPENRRKNLFFFISSPSASNFCLELVYKGREKPILMMDLILDDLLERKKISNLEKTKLNIQDNPDVSNPQKVVINQSTKPLSPKLLLFASADDWKPLHSKNSSEKTQTTQPNSHRISWEMLRKAVGEEDKYQSKKNWSSTKGKGVRKEPIAKRLNLEDIKVFGVNPLDQYPFLVACDSCGKSVNVPYLRSHQEIECALSIPKKDERRGIISKGKEKPELVSRKRELSEALASEDSQLLSGRVEETKAQKRAKTKQDPKISKDKDRKKTKGSVSGSKNNPKSKVVEFDLDKQCGVVIPPSNKQCTRSLTCKAHSMAMKRAVRGRSQPFDTLLQAHLAKSRTAKHARTMDTAGGIRRTAAMATGEHNSMSVNSLFDEISDSEGHDSDSEAERIISAAAQHNPKPLATRQILMPRRRQQYLKAHDLFHDALRPSSLPLSGRLAGAQGQFGVSGGGLGTGSGFGLKSLGYGYGGNGNAFTSVATVATVHSNPSMAAMMSTLRMANTMSLIKVEHPVLHEKMCRLRDKNTTSREFRLLMGEISNMLMYEATKTIQLVENGKIQTPVSTMAKLEINNKIALIPILRAGTGMLESALSFLPESTVFHIGLFREKETLQPVEYYNKLPLKCEYDECIILDPMVATGGTCDAAIQILNDWGIKKIKVLTICGSKQGLERLVESHPNVEFYVGAIDENLDVLGYVSPGIGDVGDRLFATL